MILVVIGARIRLGRRDQIVCEEFHRFAEGDATMAIQIFFFARDFGEGFAERWKEKNWIVAEAACTLRAIDQAAFDQRGNYRERLAAPRDGDDAHKMRVALVAFETAHGIEKLCDALSIACARASVARGLHAGSAAESWNYKARIIGYHQFIA